jgi:hypothetical protein
MAREPARKIDPPTLRQLMRMERFGRIRTWCVAGTILLLDLGILYLACPLSPDDWEGFFVFQFMISAPTVAFVALSLGRFDKGKTRRDLHHFLARYGDVRKQTEQIDSELHMTAEVHEFDYMPSRFRGTSGTILLTKSWLLSFGPESICFLRVDDILWFFKRYEVRNQWWGISHRPVVQLSCLTNRGMLYALAPVHDDTVDELIEFLAWRRPEALFGFSDDWRNLAEEGMTAVREEVTKRRAEWERLSKFQRGDWQEELTDLAISFICRVDESVPAAQQRF